jgi:two-component system sensor kinase FixL
MVPKDTPPLSLPTGTRQADQAVVRQAVDLAPLMLRGTDGVISFWAKGLERLYGFKADEAIGQPCHVLLETEFPSPLPQIEEEFFDRGEWNGELENRRRDGRTVRVASHWSLLRNHESGSAIVTEVNIYISSTKERETTAFLASLVESSEDAILSKSLEGIITSWNAAAERLFGYSALEACGQTVTMLFPRDLIEEEQLILKRIIEGEKIEHYETVRRTKSGAEIDVSLSISPIRDRTGTIVGASKIVRDITAQKKALARVEELQSELLHISRLNTVGHMAAALAHELNQPLTAISNYVSGIRRLLATTANQQVNEALARAAEQTERAGDVVQRLRDFVVKGESRKQLMDVNQLVEESLRLGLVGSKSLGIKVETRLGQNLTPALIDRVQIGQVILNIVRNALEAMQDSANRRLVLTTRTLPKGNGVEIAISDTGPGISPEIAHKLFQPFVTTKPSGMGIGLSVCRDIVEAHDGAILAAANEEGGTTFRIVLPLQTESADRDSI